MTIKKISPSIALVRRADILYPRRALKLKIQLDGLPQTGRTFVGGANIPFKVYSSEYIKDMVYVTKDLDQAGSALVWRAFEKAHAAFLGVKRLSGRPFIEHLLDTAFILKRVADIRDPAMLAAALLHDYLEDLGKDDPQLIGRLYKELKKEFGAEVADLVYGETKLSMVSSREKLDVEYQKKLTKEGERDSRVPAIKAADCLSNMYDHQEDVFGPEKVIEHAKEALDYSRHMRAMGVWEMRELLEEVAIKYLDPVKYKAIYGDYGNTLKKAAGFSAVFEELKAEIGVRLRQIGLDSFKIEVRSRTFAEVYRKMERENKTLSELLAANPLYLSFILVEIDTEDEDKCNLAMNLLRKSLIAGFAPVNEVIKDNISKPRQDGYRALQSKFSREGFEGQLLVTVATKQMNVSNRLGFIAEGIKSNFKKGWHIKKFDWLSKLVSFLDKDFTSEQLRELVDEFTYSMTVYDPQNREYKPRPGSKALDYAFLEEVDDLKSALRAKEARINGVTVPLDTELKENDRVDIIYDEAIQARPIWISWARTSRAAEKTREHLNGLEVEERETIAQHAIDEAGAPFYIRCKDVMGVRWMPTFLKALDRQFKVRLTTVGDLLVALGQGKFGPVGMMDVFLDEYHRFLAARESFAQLNKKVFLLELDSPDEPGVMGKITEAIARDHAVNLESDLSYGVGDKKAKIFLALAVYDELQKARLITMLKEMLKSMKKEDFAGGVVSFAELEPREFEKRFGKEKFVNVVNWLKKNGKKPT